nr:MAG TPA: hypothetical protein [Caudoviricetes sp.]
MNILKPSGLGSGGFLLPFSGSLLIWSSCRGSGDIAASGGAG